MTRDQQGQGKGLADYLNEERPDALLLLAWNYYRKRSAVKSVISEITDKGFHLKLSYGKNIPEESVTYEFPGGSVKDASKLKITIGKLLISHSGASMPPAVTSFAVIMLWIVILIGAASERDLMKYPFLSYVQPYVMVIFRKSIYAVYALFAMIIAHTLEGLYVGYLCNTLSMPKSSGVSWVGLAFLMGYPTTSQVMLLAHIGRKKKIRYN